MSFERYFSGIVWENLRGELPQDTFEALDRDRLPDLTSALLGALPLEVQADLIGATDDDGDLAVVLVPFDAEGDLGVYVEALRVGAIHWSELF